MQMASIDTAIVSAGHWPPHKRRELPLHTDTGLELILVQHGSAYWRIDDRVEHVPAGCVFYSFPWQVHGGLHEQEPGLELHFVTLRLDRPRPRPAKRFEFHPSLGFAPEVGRRICRTLCENSDRAVPASDELVWWIVQGVTEHRRNGATTESHEATLARGAAVELTRCVEAGRSAEDDPTQREQMVRRFLVELESRLDEPWTLESMAKQCGLGRTRFSEWVKRLTGDPPIMALNRMRVRHAQYLLRATPRSVLEIALAVGFQSHAYFTRVFAAYAGQSPTRYRAAQGR